MKEKAYLKTLTILLLLITAPFAASAQRQPGTKSTENLNYGFVSPNTKEGLKLEEAINGLDSLEERKLIQQAVKLRCVVKTEIRVYRALGSWTDGAEHSTMVQLRADQPTIRYFVSRLGREMDQKAVLYFHADESGQSKLYILRPNKIRKLQTIIKLLDRAGIVYRTLVPTRTSMFVYIVDNENNLRDKVLSATKLLNARTTARTGTAQFIGDDSQREKAKQIYTQELEEYERTHPDVRACRGN